MREVVTKSDGEMGDRKRPRRERGGEGNQQAARSGEASLTNEGHGPGVDDAAGQQVEVILSAVHDHCVARVVAPL